MLKYVTDITNGIYLKEEVVKEHIFKRKLSNQIVIEFDKVIAKYLGMGGALTEASSYNYSLLSDENKINFINDCYSKQGLNYNYARISIGSCDFSLSYYSYAKKKDLSDFNIDNDKKYIIPLIKDILKIKSISIIASPWSPPVMYKRIKCLRFGFKLAKKYYDNYSNYLINFIDSYHKENINIEYITMQNEPLARQRWESCKYSFDEQKDFIYNYLLPKLTSTKLLLFDHNKDDLFNTVKELYQEDIKIAGVAFHNYSGSHFNELDKIRKVYPNIKLINTEGCTGFSSYNEKLWINDAEYYLNDIMGDFNHGTNAYLDWNILLNKEGGPSHIKNPVKSILIFDKGNYFKTPIYYYIYHISHFVNEMNIVRSYSCLKDLNVLSFQNKDKLVVIIMNKEEKSYRYNLVINKEYISDEIKPHSIITYVYKFKKNTSHNEKNII